MIFFQMSECIGNYLDDHQDIPSKDLFEELTAQYGEFVNSFIKEDVA